MVGGIEENLENIVEYRVGRACIPVLVGLDNDSMVSDVILADEVLVGWCIGFIN